MKSTIATGVNLGLLACAVMVLAACAQGEKVPQASESGEARKSVLGIELPKWPFNRSTESDPVAVPKVPVAVTPAPGLPAVSKTTVEVQCKTPAENYDFSATITSRFGAEGQARLQALMTSNFARASLTPRDREMLKVLSRDMLWIPVPVEVQIGNALNLAASRDITVLSKEDNSIIWQKSLEMLANLSSVAPQNPFEVRLLLLDKGEPGSHAGGLIYVDNDTIKSVFDNPSQTSEEKLRFVLAHELAHIYKRHRAKRIQQTLVDSDAGLKLMRQIFSVGKTSAKASDWAAIQSWAQTALVMPEIVKSLLAKHEAYGMAQESEADACAAAMMLSAKLGDPLRAFRAYARDAAQAREANKRLQPTPGSDAFAGAGEIFRTHPPDSAREANIGAKMREYGVNAAPSRQATPPAGSTTPPRNRGAPAKVGGVAS